MDELVPNVKSPLNTHLSFAACRLPTYPGRVIEPATLWERLPPETQQAVRQHWDGTVPADVAADITRAGGLDYTWWLGERPRAAAGDWRMRPSFVAYVDQIGAEEWSRRTSGDGD